MEPPIEVAGPPASVRRRFGDQAVEVGAAFLRALDGACRISTEDTSLAGAGRDWWPLTLGWALDGEVPAVPAAVARPTTTAEVAAVLRLCAEHRVPVTTAAGRSGVCGGAVPVHGGVVLDVTGLAGVVAVDRRSLVLDVRAATFGDRLEAELAGHGVTLGHWPQSMALSTVGGWLACRSAGQYSTRYGKIEDMVLGLEAVLADGRVVRTGGHPRSAVGPDLTQLFVGSEGTLGVITEARLRLHPRPAGEWRAAFGFDSFAEGLDACRRVVQRGATPAVLRLYDAIEAARTFGADQPVLVVLDEGDRHVLAAVAEVVGEECGGAGALDEELVGRWIEHRNDVSALEGLVRAGMVVDTMEVAAPWAALPRLHERATAALAAVPGTLAASAHESHAYVDGACLYFTFVGRPAEDGPEAREAYYRAAWDAATDAVLAEGGNLSHHHGVGLNRARFVSRALGPAFDVLVAVKAALDPAGILNPGKLGLPSPFGASPAWP